MEKASVRPGSFAVLLTVFACAPTEDAQLALRARFACQADREKTQEVELQLVSGGCFEAAPLVMSAVQNSGEPKLAFDAVVPGRYGFRAIARAENVTVAQGCRSADLPTTAPIEIAMEPYLHACAEAIGDVATPLPIMPDAQAEAPEDAGTAGHDDKAQILPPEPHSDAGTAQEGTGYLCSCACAAPPCLCVDSTCISGSMTLSYSGATGSGMWQLEGDGPALDPTSVVKTGIDPGKNVGRRILREPSPDILLSRDLFGASAEIDAIALDNDGNLLLSTKDPAVLDSEPFDDDEIVGFDPLSQQIWRALDFGTYLSPVNGSDVDVDALQITAGDSIYFSVDDRVRVNATGALFEASDLLLFSGSAITRVVRGSSQWQGRDLESLAVNPVTGNFLISLGGQGAIDSGPAFGPSDVIELAFGPGDPVRGGYSLFLEAESELPEAPGALTGLAMRD